MNKKTGKPNVKQWNFPSPPLCRKKDNLKEQKKEQKKGGVFSLKRLTIESSANSAKKAIYAIIYPAIYTAIYGAIYPTIYTIIYPAIYSRITAQSRIKLDYQALNGLPPFPDIYSKHISFKL